MSNYDTLVEQWATEYHIEDADFLKHTAKRMQSAYAEYLCGYLQDPAAYLEKKYGLDKDIVGCKNYRPTIEVLDIHFASLCRHHALPFTGTIDFRYIPSTHVVGLSKIPRMIHAFAKRFQMQEELGEQIVNTFWEVVKPISVKVRIKAIHACLCYRGAKQLGASMVTTHGRFEHGHG